MYGNCIFKIYGSADRYANESLFCAQNHTYGVDTCQGDSGGPITCTEDGLNYMYGITSFGVGCNDKKYPGNSSNSDIVGMSVELWLMYVQGLIRL